MLDNILLLILLNALYYWVVFSTGTRFLKFIQQLPIVSYFYDKNESEMKTSAMTDWVLVNVFFIIILLVMGLNAFNGQTGDDSFIDFLFKLYIRVRVLL